MAFCARKNLMALMFDLMIDDVEVKNGKQRWETRR